MHKKIAVLSGDGIGVEVMTQTLRVLDVIAKKHNHNFVYLDEKIGGAAYEYCQSHCPEQTLETCSKADAILFGSVGGASDQQHLAKWKNCETNSILKLRKQFNLNINIRPIKVYPELAGNCPLKPEIIGNGVDIEIFRELSGGLYFGRHEQMDNYMQRSAMDECIYGEAQIKSIAHAAFKAAQMRKKRVCSVDKANVLATSKLWREVVTEVSADYPDVELTHMLVDNCAMQMVINPCQFDVIVTENMFGDIISDLGASLPGSLGLIPSASFNDNNQGLYEPSGGSAPEIAGQGIANPSAQILSAAMMLRYAFGLHKEACVIENAVRATIASGVKTFDIASDKKSSVTAQSFVDSIITHIDSDP